jgi:hypothetical protein
VLGLGVAVLPAAGHAAPGDLDRAFGAKGKRAVAFWKQATAFSLAIQGRRIVVAGIAEPSRRRDPRVRNRGFADFAVARLRAKGRLDRAFSKNGKLTTNFGGRANRAPTWPATSW